MVKVHTFGTTDMGRGPHCSMLKVAPRSSIKHVDPAAQHCWNAVSSYWQMLWTPLHRNQTHVSSACKPTKQRRRSSCYCKTIRARFLMNVLSCRTLGGHPGTSKLLSFAIQPVQHEHRRNAYREVLSVHALYRRSLFNRVWVLSRQARMWLAFMVASVAWRCIDWKIELQETCWAATEATIAATEESFRSETV